MGRVLIKNLEEHKDKTVSVSGWVNVRRDHGKLIFIDIRDYSGVIQGLLYILGIFVQSDQL